MNTPIAIERPILLLGIGGRLWRAWNALLDAHRLDHYSPTLDELNFLRPETITDVLDERFSLVINAAAYTDVDGCESNQELATVVNATGVGQLARRCAQLDCKLVHYSTDYVFDGSATRPYATNHPRDPANAYGKTKAEGEQFVEQSGCDFLLIRTSWLYAPWGNNFVRTISRLAAERSELRVVSDQRGRPTSAQSLAAASMKLLKAAASGVYHVADGGECTWYELAQEIVARRQSTCRVEPCATVERARRAVRPAYSVLDLDGTETLIGPMRPWREHLQTVLDNLEED